MLHGEMLAKTSRKTTGKKPQNDVYVFILTFTLSAEQKPR
jgi:hypothetical protein